MSISNVHLKKALGNMGGSGSTVRNNVSLEDLIRRRQDELRGRPENCLDRFRDWRLGIDWSFVAFTSCVALWGLCQMVIAVASILERG